MKVEHSTTLVNTQPPKDMREVSGRKTETASDEVKLSSLASQLLASGSDAPFDVKRVGEIKEAISAGLFSINTGAIADRIIASAKELLAPQQNSSRAQ